MVDAAKWLYEEPGLSAGGTGDSERRIRVIASATQAIDESGPAVSMGRVAELAGIPRPHIYRYVANKETLDIEVARLASADLMQRVRPYFTRSGTSAEILQGVLTPIIDWAAEHPSLYRFIAAQKQTRALHQIRLGRTRFLDEIIAAASAFLRPARLVDDAPEGVVASVIGMADAGIIWWIDHRDETQHEIVDRLARQIHVVFKDAIMHLGLDFPDDMVFNPEV
ncbi:hypothetical protein GCM10011609_87750 [Lentzea pudingi]|uniref:HTH tetR-type domain-containing protein n=1 Tax=Lentzea pudingi TaxID=1789439 RepID=A0ABQ2IW58_9PSEU|nr:TetR/AcrR family transcriptional regulator [Lentzea pudingi]GGN30164.1 hypothetical protein GCM10011609_87750 [Lentzea pudingi]